MLTHATLLAALKYDPETGWFTWRVRADRAMRWNSRYANGRAGGEKPNQQGYLTAVINYRQYTLHRLAWLYMTGEWPKEEIDHKNTDRSDNRWKNLREASRSQQTHNSSLRCDNSIGLKGVVRKVLADGSPRYTAMIAIDKRRIWLGSHACPLAASLAHQLAAISHVGEFARAA